MQRLKDHNPLAQAYAGHQFGGFSPQLGDGRALLLGEVIDTKQRRRDIQLKGSGRTPFSRGGDGKAAVGPVLREYLIGEAMNALGIPTTRALAAVSTGANVYRETVLPGAILTRVASSHIRVGTFQFAAGRRDKEKVRKLADYSISRHYPETADAENPYLAFFSKVVDVQSSLVARWMCIGFIHGVMNTDNMDHLWRDHRLRTLRLHGPLFTKNGIQFHRSWRPLCLWKPTTHIDLEPCPVG